MKKQTLVVILTVAMLLLLLGAANGNLLAGPPTPEKMTITGDARNAFTYQGRLTDASGKPLDGQYNMTFQLWDALIDGSQVGNDILVNNVVVENGIFNTTIPVPDRTFNGRALWLRIKVGTEWLEPRQEIVAVPYAMSLIPGASMQVATAGDYSTLLWLENTATADRTRGIVAGNASPDGVGVVGYNLATTGEAKGVYGETAAPNGRAIYGANLSTVGDNCGVCGNSESPDGKGVSGWSTVGGDGVSGWTSGGDSNNLAAGVWGGTNISASVGVDGWNGATSGGAVGVIGHSDSPDGTGVYGLSEVGGDGVRGWTNGGDSNNGGSGVWGGTNLTSSVGINAWNGGGGTAIYGESVGGSGIQIRSQFWRPFEAFGNSWDDVEFYVSNDGNVYADGTYQSPAADFAEMFPAQSGLEPGDVLIIGLDGKLARSTEPYQMAVVGIYSTQPGFLGGASEDASMSNQIPLAIVGIVPVKVSAENGAIHPGDLLTPSATPGYAMVCQNRLDCVGAIIGKALEPLEEGTGMITVLITLQ